MNKQQHLETDWKKATTESASGEEKTGPRLPQIWKDQEPRESSTKKKVLLKKKKKKTLWPDDMHQDANKFGWPRKFYLYFSMLSGP